MRAIEIAQPGGPEVLREVQRPDPVAKPGELLIAVQASGINRPDVLKKLFPNRPATTTIPRPAAPLAGLTTNSDCSRPATKIGLRAVES